MIFQDYSAAMQISDKAESIMRRSGAAILGLKYLAFSFGYLGY